MVPGNGLEPRHGPNRALRRELGRDPGRAHRLRQGAEVLRLQRAQPRRRQAWRVRDRRDLRPLLRPRHTWADHREAPRARVGRRRPVRHLPDDEGRRRDARRVRQGDHPAVHRGRSMKRAVVLAGLALALAPLAAGCGGTKKKAASSKGTGCAVSQLNLKKSGTLTIGTDNPAYPPWYGGSPRHGWENSDPDSGKGYESAVAHAPAQQPRLSPSQGTL